MALVAPNNTSNRLPRLLVTIQGAHTTGDETGLTESRRKMHRLCDFRVRETLSRLSLVRHRELPTVEWVERRDLEFPAECRARAGADTVMV